VPSQQDGCQLESLTLVSVLFVKMSRFECHSVSYNLLSEKSVTCSTGGTIHLLGLKHSSSSDEWICCGQASIGAGSYHPALVTTSAGDVFYTTGGNV